MMKAALACLLPILTPVSCATYSIPSLETEIEGHQAVFRGRKIDITPLIPGFKRAVWTNARQGATVWKVQDELILDNGSRIRLISSGGSFRIDGTPGEYFIRQEDLTPFLRARDRLLRQPDNSSGH